MTMPESAHFTHHHTSYKADLLRVEVEMEGTALAAPVSGAIALLFEKTPDLAGSPDAGDRDGRTWVWNGRTWVWNGARLGNSRTWVWNGKVTEFSSDYQEFPGKSYPSGNWGDGLL